MIETLDASRPVHPPIQSIAQATHLRDQMIAAIADLVSDFERETKLDVASMSLSRQTVTDRIGRVTIKLQVNVQVRLP